jgi:hypothetical protein
MQEYCWLHGNSLDDMIRVLEKEQNSRKLGLAACGCIRSVWEFFRFPQLVAAVETAEDYSDFTATRQQAKAVRAGLAAMAEEARESNLRDKEAVPDWAWSDPEGAEWMHFGFNGWATQIALIEIVLRPARVNPEALGRLLNIVQRLSNSRRLRPPEQHASTLCALLRDVFSNPFRPVTFDPSWRTETAVLIARGMYESRDFSAMPILADALQDAGCENADILTHCRDESLTHVRGCWVVDLVLAKE